MKKKLALLLSAVMVVGMIPATAFAISTNEISRIVTGTDEQEYVGDDAPTLMIHDKNLNELKESDVTFKLTLSNAEWNLIGADGKEIKVGDSATLKQNSDIEVSLLSAKQAIVTATLSEVRKGKMGLIMPLETEISGEGDATVTIDPMDSVISSGTYKFANVVSGSTSTTIEKVTDIQENGSKIKPIVITETAAGSLEGSASGQFKLKLTNGFKFENAVNGTTLDGVAVTAYPDELGAYTIEKHKDSEEIYIKFDNMKSKDFSTSKAATISISGLVVGYDDDDVEVGDIGEITISGYDMKKATIEVAKAVTYGVSVEAENKTLPTFIAGRADRDVDSLKVTLKENVFGSWLDSRKAEITFPEGVKVIDTEVEVKDGLTDVTVTPDHKDETTVLKLNATRDKSNDKAKVEFTFTLSVDPAFTGDIKAKFTGAAFEEDMEVVIGTVVAPVTVEAETNEVSIDYRNVEIGDIIIKETEAGNLEKGKTLYLGLEYLSFDGTPTVEVVEGDIKIDSVDVIGDGVLAIKVKTASQKTPAVLKVTDNQLFLGRSIPAGSYELSLVYNEKGTDAIFQNFVKDLDAAGADQTKFETDEVVVLKDFVEVVTAGRDQDDSTFTTQITVTIGADKLIAGKTEIALDVPAYISEGYTMLPVRAVTEALSGKAIVRWDDATKTVTITFGSRVISMTVGSKTMTINGVAVQMTKACEITDSRAFIPLRDLGYALGLNDSKIKWDDATKTATLN